MPPPDGMIGKLTEEIKVEYQVLENAANLDMSSEEFNTLAAGRQGYIAQLKALYEQESLPWPPADLVPYLQNPPKP